MSYVITMDFMAIGDRRFREKLKQIARRRNPDNFHYTAQAVAKITREAQKTMLQAVQGRAVSWSGGTIYVRKQTGALHGAILGSYRYPYGNNPLRGALVIRHPHYRWIVEGIRPFDMKPGLLRNAMRFTRDGRRYRVVSFIPRRMTGRIFRIVTDRSKGWIHPGTEPQRLDLYTNEQMKSRAIRELRRAMKRDLGR